MHITLELDFQGKGRINIPNSKSWEEARGEEGREKEMDSSELEFGAVAYHIRAVVLREEVYRLTMIGG